jgi:hypothetical protein
MQEIERDEYFRQEASKESRRLDTLSLAELLQRVRRRRFDRYFQLWDSIMLRGDLRQAGWTLYAVLLSRTGYLNRYHCASALLALMQRTDVLPSDLTVPHKNPREKLRLLRADLEKSIGPAPAEAISWSDGLLDRWSRRLTGR